MAFIAETAPGKRPETRRGRKYRQCIFLKPSYLWPGQSQDSAAPCSKTQTYSGLSQKPVVWLSYALAFM